LFFGQDLWTILFNQASFFDWPAMAFRSYFAFCSTPVPFPNPWLLSCLGAGDPVPLDLVVMSGLPQRRVRCTSPGFFPFFFARLPSSRFVPPDCSEAGLGAVDLSFPLIFLLTTFINPGPDWNFPRLPVGFSARPVAGLPVVCSPLSGASFLWHLIRRNALEAFASDLAQAGRPLESEMPRVKTGAF